MRVQSLTTNYTQMGFICDVDELLSIVLDDDLYYYNCEDKGLFLPIVMH
jgi:hypothetical protein